MRGFRRVVYVLAWLAPTAASIGTVDAGWDGPPRLDGLPPKFGGFPKHGEFMAAGVGCGQRRPDWEQHYRRAVEAAARARALGPHEADEVMRHVDAYAAYARRQVASNRREYCAWTANPVDLASGDAIVAGRERVR